MREKRGRQVLNILTNLLIVLGFLSVCLAHWFAMRDSEVVTALAGMKRSGLVDECNGKFGVMFLFEVAMTFAIRVLS
jgi:L-asparaginase II